MSEVPVPVLMVIQQGKHLVVMNPDGVLICPQICLHSEERQKVMDEGNYEDVAVMVLLALAREFEHQAQRLRARWN